MIKRIYALLQKDVLLEFRQKHTFYGILLYIASTIFVLYLSIDKPDASVWNGLFWTHSVVYLCKCCSQKFFTGKPGPDALLL